MRAVFSDVPDNKGEAILYTWLFLRWFYLRELHELYPFQTDLLRTSHQTRIWGEQWMTFLGNPYVNTRPVRSVRPFIPASRLGWSRHALLWQLVWVELDIRIIVYTCRKSSQWLFSFGISSFYYNIFPLYSANANKYNRLPLFNIYGS